MAIERDRLEMDVLLVGAGPANLSCALHLTNLINAHNERAQAAYRKAGFVEEGRLRQAMYREGVYHDILVMGLLRDEFEALHLSARVQETAR